MSATETVFGTLEEHLYYHGHIMKATEFEPVASQLDLLISVKRKLK